MDTQKYTLAAPIGLVFSFCTVGSISIIPPPFSLSSFLQHTLSRCIISLPSSSSQKHSFSLLIQHSHNSIFTFNLYHLVHAHSPTLLVVHFIVPISLYPYLLITSFTLFILLPLVCFFVSLLSTTFVCVFFWRHYISIDPRLVLKF